MPTALPANSVWSAMSYVPPRGRCNHKTSLMSPACPCLRFMLHPVKAATSFECDGCNHHASFHSLENKTEDDVVRRWEEQAVEEEKKRAEAQAMVGATKKRRRVKGKEEDADRVIVEVFDDEEKLLEDGEGEGVYGRTMALFTGGGASTRVEEQSVKARPKRGKKPAD